MRQVIAVHPTRRYMSLLFGMIIVPCLLAGCGNTTSEKSPASLPVVQPPSGQTSAEMGEKYRKAMSSSRSHIPGSASPTKK